MRRVSRRWPFWVARRELLLGLLLALVPTAVAVSPATAAYPGSNGVIAYAYPDPEPQVDAAYLAFMTPDGQFLDWTLNGYLPQRYAPVFSPDGQQLAYDGAGRWLTSIGVTSVPTRRERVLTRPTLRGADSNPTWSPDGGSIAFDRYVFGRRNAFIFTQRVDGGGLRRLSRGEDPAWSTLGEIAFVRYIGDRAVIHVVNSAGGPVRRLTSGPSAYNPNWSPDGQRVAFERRGHIFTVAADGSGLIRLTAGRRRNAFPAFAPDGQSIVFTRGANHLGIVPSTGGSVRTLRCEERGCQVPDWQPVPAAP